MDNDLNYRPSYEDLTRKGVSDLTLEIKKARADAKSGILPTPTDTYQASLDKEVSDMTNAERNAFIFAYNTGKVEPDVPRTEKMIRILVKQSELVNQRAQIVSEVIKKDLPNISTANAPSSVIKSMKLIYGEDVDTTKITPDQLQCAIRTANSGSKLYDDPQYGTADNTLGVSIDDPRSPINIKGVPTDKKQFDSETMNSKIFGLWYKDPLMFLRLLIKLIFDIIAFMIRVAFCPVIVLWVPVGALIAEACFFVINALLKLKGNDAYHCVGLRKKCRDIAKDEALKYFKIEEKQYNKELHGTICEAEQAGDLSTFVEERMKTYVRVIERGGDPFQEGPIENAVPDPICGAAGEREPTAHEVMAANEIVGYSMDQSKESSNQQMKDFVGLASTTSAEEETIVLKGTLNSTSNKVALVRSNTDNGVFGTEKLKDAPVTNVGLTKFDDKFVQYLAMITESLRNIDIMVSGAMELKFLSYRFRDTICCFIRILYAMFIGNDDLKVMGKNIGKSVQDKMSQWDADYNKAESEVRKYAQKIKIIAKLLDVLLSTFTTTVSTSWEIKLGDFSPSGFGKMLIGAIRKLVFEALATLNEALFARLRKMIFGFIDKLTDADKELRRALEECDLFNIALNWLQCLLNWLENLIMQQLTKIRGDQDYAWGQIEINYDFIIQNKQITLIRDILGLLGKWSLKVVQICNINNIKDQDAFQQLVADVSNEAGVAPYLTETTPTMPVEAITSVMDPKADHTGLNGKLATFAQQPKGNYGLSVQEFAVVDRGSKPSENIGKLQTSATPKDRGADSDKAAQDQDKVVAYATKETVIPETMFVTKGEFVDKCNKCYAGVHEMFANNKTLRDLLSEFDLDVFV